MITQHPVLRSLQTVHLVKTEIPFQESSTSSASLRRKMVSRPISLLLKLPAVFNTRSIFPKARMRSFLCTLPSSYASGGPTTLISRLFLKSCDIFNASVVESTTYKGLSALTAAAILRLLLLLIYCINKSMTIHSPRLLDRYKQVALLPLYGCL